ncbi:MAG: tRNA (adenosine(37)-N6)-dimethylallyltransferase MiaA [Ruminococcaceae bacterium]|nr:tRNA (adenosine(37)-N6)-dimethylallyltransferase MiaA [Oscillospiraceae bacterium]
MIPMLVIAGPTASGKTALAIELAKKIGGEVVSADSMQVYTGMNIGTAKPDEAEKAGVPHHLLDVVSPDTDFSLARFAELAHTAIADIYARGKVPILAGGTGLYIDTVMENRPLSENSFDPALRTRLQSEWEEKGAEAMYAELMRLDPAAAGKLHPNEKRRILRALEIYFATGETKTAHLEKKSEKIYDYFVFALELPREILYNRINRRVDAMLEAGLLDEVRAVYAPLRGKQRTALQGVGYKELIWYLEGRATFEEAVELLKRNTRRLAKRQMTWFRANPSIIWLDGQKPSAALCEECIARFQAGKGEAR